MEENVLESATFNFNVAKESITYPDLLVKKFPFGELFFKSVIFLNSIINYDYNSTLQINKELNLTSPTISNKQKCECSAESAALLCMLLEESVADSFLYDYSGIFVLFAKSAQKEADILISKYESAANKNVIECYGQVLSDENFSLDTKLTMCYIDRISKILFEEKPQVLLVPIEIMKAIQVCKIKITDDATSNQRNSNAFFKKMKNED